MVARKEPKMNFLDVLKALKLGHEVRDPKTWKNRQQLLNVVSFLTLMGVNQFLPEATVSEDMLTYINGGIVSFMMAFNAYLIPATSKKIGVKKNADKT
jgi:hypothetical protein